MTYECIHVHVDDEKKELDTLSLELWVSKSLLIWALESELVALWWRSKLSSLEDLEISPFSGSVGDFVYKSLMALSLCATIHTSNPNPWFPLLCCLLMVCWSPWTYQKCLPLVLLCKLLTCWYWLTSNPKCPQEVIFSNTLSLCLLSFLSGQCCPLLWFDFMEREPVWVCLGPLGHFFQLSGPSSAFPSPGLSLLWHVWLLI